MLLVFKWTRDRGTAWLAGGIFVATAVVTEAVSGVVGLADVLGGAGALLALLALNLRLTTMPIALFGATMLGLYSKESALCIVPTRARSRRCSRPSSRIPSGRCAGSRAIVAALTAGIAFVFYVEMRRRWFPVATPHDLTVEANAGKPTVHRAFVAALRWYAQPMLPHDPLNNPLIDASPPYRVAGALRVYVTRGLGQVLFPRTLSGDYSAPQEPIPDTLVFPESVLGALAMVLAVRRRARRRASRRGGAGGGRAASWSYRRPRDLAAASSSSSLVWCGRRLVLPGLEHPRGPADGARRALLVLPGDRDGTVLGDHLREALRARHGAWRALPAAIGLFALFFGFQCFAARRHALDYKNDLVFWDATRKAVPAERQGAPQLLGHARRARGPRGAPRSNDVALSLAPEWPMASVYEGDTLCRLHRAPEALPHYLRGFGLGPNDRQPHRAGPAVPVGREAQLDDERACARRAAGAGRQAPRVVAQVPGGRHARQRRGVQGREPQVPPARVQRGAEEGRVAGAGGSFPARGSGRVDLSHRLS